MVPRLSPTALRMRISSAAGVLVLTGSLIAGLGLPGPATLAQSPGVCASDTQVVPGAAVGPLRLGMPVAEGGRLLGTPPLPVKKGTISTSTWEQWYFFPRTDVELLAKDSAVVRIVVGAGTPDTRRCATPEGIRLGSPGSALTASYGAPDGASILRNGDDSQVMAFWVYDKRGLQVMLDSGNRVLALDIFTPGAFCGLQESLRALGWDGEDCAALTPPLSSSGTTQTSRPEPTPQAPQPLAAGRIAFVSDRDGSDQIYVATGGGATRLTSPPGTNWSPAFSPDGQKIVFNSKRDEDWQIYLMDADGSHITQLTSPLGINAGPRFSPDGRTIGFMSSRGGLFQIYTMGVDGSNVTRLTSPPGASLGPDFSRDGRRITFQSNRDGAFQVYAMNVDGSDLVRLTTVPEASTSPAFSPDGRKIVFDSDRSGSSQIHIMDADGSNVARLTGPPGESVYPSFSADGTKILFSSTRGGSEQVYVMNVDGSSVVALTSGPGQSFFPVFAP